MQTFQQKRALGFVPGIVVTVDVTLSPETIYREKSLEYDEPPIGSETVSTTPQSSEMVGNVAPSVDRTIERVLFLPEVVTVAILAPRDHLRRILRSRGKGDEFSPTGMQQLESEFTETIENISVALIPKAPPGEDTFPRVMVVWHEEPGAESGTP